MTFSIIHVELYSKHFLGFSGEAKTSAKKLFAIFPSLAYYSAAGQPISSLVVIKMMENYVFQFKVHSRATELEILHGNRRREGRKVYLI